VEAVRVASADAFALGVTFLKKHLGCPPTVQGNLAHFPNAIMASAVAAATAFSVAVLINVLRNRK
jgi:hypothetical protein